MSNPPAPPLPTDPYLREFFMPAHGAPYRRIPGFTHPEQLDVAITQGDYLGRIEDPDKLRDAALRYWAGFVAQNELRFHFDLIRLGAEDMIEIEPCTACTRYLATLDERDLCEEMAANLKVVTLARSTPPY
jgi:hypothetical protein